MNRIYADKNILSNFRHPARHPFEILFIRRAKLPFQRWLFVQDNEKVNSDEREDRVNQ